MYILIYKNLRTLIYAIKFEIKEKVINILICVYEETCTSQLKAY